MPGQLHQKNILVEPRCIVEVQCIASQSKVEPRCIAALRIIIFFIFFCALIPFQGYANAPNREMGIKFDQTADREREIIYDQTNNLQIPQFDQQTLDTFKQQRAFDYSEKHQENWWTTFKNWLWELWLKFWHWLVGDYQANGFIAFLVHALPYLIVIGILIFISWLFYKLNPGATFFRSKEKPELFFSEEEEIIRNKDISQLMEQALADKEYRLAVRYYYLLILQKLTEAEIISYESDKTNSEYISEITSEALKSGFTKATNLYDHVWYGNFEVTEADFMKARPVFSSLKNQIPNPVA